MNQPMLDRRKLLTLLCCILISACADIEDRWSATTPAPTKTSIWDSNKEGGVSAWLSSYRILANSSLEEQRKEFLAAQAVLSKEPNESNRLRLALVLSLPGVPWRDESRILNILEAPPSLIKMQDSPVHQLGFLLYKQAQERQRLREDLRRRDTELLEEKRRNEEQKQRLREDQRRYETELLEGQRRNGELQMKLDALRRIDQDIKRRKHTLESSP